MVDIAYVRVHILDVCIGCFLVHRNNNLFVRGSLSGHFDVRLGFALAAIDDLLDLVDLVVLKFGEHLFDLESIHYCIGVLEFRKSLSI